MAASDAGVDASKYKLKAFENAAAGHEGVQTDEEGEVIIKPCTQAEIDFYQESASEHPKFYELMPTFMGTLQLGQSAAIPSDLVNAQAPTEPISEEFKDQKLLHGKALTTETAIVLANLEHGFTRPNVLDLKLGARLYAAGTKPEKAERLDKVAAETTSGSLNFRITGMKVWNGQTYDVYDKFYGRKFTAENVQDGFAAFFASLIHGLKADDAQELLETILAEIVKARHSLERSESRFYGASVLIVYEGDAEMLESVVHGGRTVKPRADEKAPTSEEVQQSLDEEDEEDDEPPVTHRVKMIDFAHAAWVPGQGPDENVIKGLKNIEVQLDDLIAQI